jgi:hypothetical protein
METDQSPDPDPAIVVNNLQDGNKNFGFISKLFSLLLFKGKFTIFFKDKNLQHFETKAAPLSVKKITKEASILKMPYPVSGKKWAGSAT